MAQKNQTARSSGEQRENRKKPARATLHSEDARREAEVSGSRDPEGHSRQDAPALSTEKPHRDQSEAV